ncbi:MAG: Nif3-like dinuclear metal center hexameric protein, partial [Eggerthellaceae bacterium]|nr:Nif3-like dinuclear metal center hexameric protein [Eggerthellaceae bacterium]
LFLDPPEVISPSRSLANPAGVTAFEACRDGIALINLHTALDASEEATHLFARLLSMEFEGLLMPLEGKPAKGYGQLCRIRKADEPFTVGRLAARCTAVFGRMPRTWGDADNVIHTVVVANGSASSVVNACVTAGVDCLICGEIHYHDALDASQCGLAILEVGHDASEAPLVALLATAAVEAGVSENKVGIIDQSGNWAYPESTRI